MSFISAPPKSPKSFFQSAAEERLFRSPKNRLFKPTRKSDLPALRKIALSDRRVKEILSHSEKLLFLAVAEKRLFRSPKNC